MARVSKKVSAAQREAENAQHRICFSALERQEEKLSAEKAEIVKQRVALYEQYADGNMSKEEFIRQRDAYRVQEDDKME